MKRKRSLGAVLTLGAVLAGCNTTEPDPCDPGHFDQKACQDAVQHHGFYSHGAFVPHPYSQPYDYYYGRYGSYVAGGGSVTSAPAGAYDAPASGVVRGGFGATGEGAGAGE